MPRTKAKVYTKYNPQVKKKHLWLFKVRVWSVGSGRLPVMSGARQLAGVSSREQSVWGRSYVCSRSNMSGFDLHLRGASGSVLVEKGDTVRRGFNHVVYYAIHHG